jgi:hypothetical protein
MDSVDNNNLRVDDLNDSVEMRILGMDKDIVMQSRVIGRKIDREEVTKIWQHF